MKVAARKETKFTGPDIISVIFVTGAGNSLGPFGVPMYLNLNYEEVNVPGQSLRYISYTSGDVLDSITFYFANNASFTI